jgi:P-type E1-E2 ATPase
VKKGSNGEIVEWEKVRDIEFEVFRKMEFNSDRKRMSIVVKDPEDGHYKMYCKGADSIIKSRLSDNSLKSEMMESIDDFLTKASVKGFRTLLMAMKVLHESEVTSFIKKCESAEKDLETKDKVLQ